MGTARKKPNSDRVCCPVCEEIIGEASFPVCQACGLAIVICPTCEKPVNKTLRVCPGCGADLSAATRKKV